MVTGTRWSVWAGRWSEFVLWLVSPFTRCGNDDLCPFIRSEFAQFNGELWELKIDDGYSTPIYVYYCPWCGRKLKQGKAT